MSPRFTTVALAALLAAIASLAAAAAQPMPPPGSSGEGAALFIAKGCGACHGAGRIEPRTMSIYTAGEIRRMIEAPQNPMMPPFALDDREAAALAAYLAERYP